MKTSREEAANQVLWHLGLGGMEPGSFVASLIETMFLADPGNLGALGREFPAHAMAVLAYKNGGPEDLRLLAGQLPPPAHGGTVPRQVCIWCDTPEPDESCCAQREMAALLDDLAPGECPSHVEPEPGCAHCSWVEMRPD